MQAELLVCFLLISNGYHLSNYYFEIFLLYILEHLVLAPSVSSPCTI